MVPFEYGAVCLSDCFMYLCKKDSFCQSADFFCLSAIFVQLLFSCGVHTGEQLAG